MEARLLKLVAGIGLCVLILSFSGEILAAESKKQDGGYDVKTLDRVVARGVRLGGGWCKSKSPFLHSGWLRQFDEPSDSSG